MEKESRIVELILRKKRSELTEEERNELELFCNESELNRQFVARYDDETYLLKRFNEKETVDTSIAWTKLKEKYDMRKNTHYSFIGFRWIKLAVAACLLLIIGASVYLWIDKIGHSGSKPQEIVKVQDLAPGTDKAILTLADGTSINLDASHNGKVADQGSMAVIKKDGLVSYSGNTNEREYAIIFNSISTPRGAQFKVGLPDGSQVWLNAQSSIRFPVKFDPAGRNVEITGEAYFEIAKQWDKSGKKKIPFIVSVNGMQVEVLGTHFNINAYDNEEAMKTTLLEGSIRVTPVPVSGGGPAARHSQLLSPGQQYQIFANNSSQLIKDADLKETLAWKEGLFRFKGASIYTIMRQISRWYNVSIKYEGDIPNREFVATISRHKNASELLRLLEKTGRVHFDIAENGNEIIVKP